MVQDEELIRFWWPWSNFQGHFCTYTTKGGQWLSGRVLDWRPRGRGLEPHQRHCVVSLSKNINPSLVLVQPRKTYPFITERLLMGCKESKQTKHTLPNLKQNLLFFTISPDLLEGFQKFAKIIEEPWWSIDYYLVTLIIVRLKFR